MMKALLRSLLILLILMAALLAFILTPMGLEVSVDLAKKLLPGELSYKKISGVIIGPIAVQDFEYKTKDQDIKISQLRISWNPLDLFKSQLHIETLDVDQLQYTTNVKSLPEQWNVKAIQLLVNQWISALQNKALPLHITIDRANLQAIQFRSPDTQTDLQKVILRVQLSKEKWNVIFYGSLQKPESLIARFSLEGKPDDYSILFLMQGDRTAWELRGIGNQQSLSLHTIHTLFLNGLLDAQITANWQAAPTWTGRLNVKNVNLSLLNPEWTQSLSIQATSAGKNADVLSTDNDLRMQTPAGSLHFAVSHKNTWHIAWHVLLNSLSSFYLNASGHVESRGKIDGDINNPHFNIWAKGKIKNNAGKIKHAKITLVGNNADHALTATVDFQRADVSLAIHGHLNHENAWHGTLQQLGIAFNRDNQWQLTKAVPMNATANAFSVSSLCLVSHATGQACFQAKLLNQHLTGSADINVTRYTWLKSLIPAIRVPSGQVHATLQMNGTTQKPNITGAIHFVQGEIFIPKLNIMLNNLNAGISSNNHTINLDAKTYSGNQPIELQGTLDLSKPDIEAQLALTATNALIVNTDQYKATATAALKALIKGSDITLTGNITLPTGTISPNDFKITTTLPDHDIVYVGNNVHPPKPFWAIHTDINIAIGNHVRVIDLFHVTGQLGGSLRLMQEPGHDAFATGQVFLRKGIFQTYGQTLTVEPNSYVDYTESLLSNPQLNLRASKVIDSVDNMGLSNYVGGKLIVGIALNGTARRPVISFFSNRGGLSQADILSYIFLGYGGSSNTPGNTDFLLRAIAAVNISSQGLLGKENVASKIQSGLGLSEMGVESETITDGLGNPLNRQSAFVVGKNLTKHFYVRYSIGLLDPVNVFELRYMFDNHWAVQTDSSTLGNGADVLYTFQRN
jgi:autotransporter translocation and assembly factor TamB